MMASQDIEHLMKLFSKLPGLGPRSGRRLVLHLLTHSQEKLEPLIESLITAQKNIKQCSECGNLDTVDPCAICTDSKRDPSSLCIVEQVADIWALERSGVFRGKYHVLGGHLSALEGIGPEDLKIPYLIHRIKDHAFTEIIFALNSTLEGQITTHYILDQLQNHPIKTTALAQGIPLGGELDYMDEGTLSAAFGSRRSF